MSRYYIARSVNGGPERVVEGEISVPTGASFSGCAGAYMAPRVTYATRGEADARAAQLRAAARRADSWSDNAPRDYIIRECE